MESNNTIDQNFLNNKEKVMQKFANISLDVCYSVPQNNSSNTHINDAFYNFTPEGIVRQVIDDQLKNEVLIVNKIVSVSSVGLPTHGTLFPKISANGVEGWRYTPNNDFVEIDYFSFKVVFIDDAIGKVEVLVNYKVNITQEKYESYLKDDKNSVVNKMCPIKIEIKEFTRTDQLINVQFNNLAPQTLGLTTDNGDGSKTITLDDNGAGYGWYSTGADVASMLSDWSSQMASVFMDSLDQYLNPVGNYVSGAVPAAEMGTAFTSLDWQKESLMIS